MFKIPQLTLNFVKLHVYFELLLRVLLIYISNVHHLIYPNDTSVSFDLSSITYCSLLFSNNNKHILKLGAKCLCHSSSLLPKKNAPPFILVSPGIAKIIALTFNDFSLLLLAEQLDMRWIYCGFWVPLLVVTLEGFVLVLTSLLSPLPTLQFSNMSWLRWVMARAFSCRRENKQIYSDVIAI